MIVSKHNISLEFVMLYCKRYCMGSSGILQIRLTRFYEFELDIIILNTYRIRSRPIFKIIMLSRSIVGDVIGQAHY